MANSYPPEVAQARDKTITQAFVAGQMDAQLKHADEMTRPALALLKEKTYRLALESINHLIATVTAAQQQEIERLERIGKSCGEQADQWAEKYRDMKQRAEAAEARYQALRAAVVSAGQVVTLGQAKESMIALRAALRETEPK